MKKQFLSLSLLLCSIAASAQWESQVAAPNMYNLNTGNVGIGKTNPGAKLDVNGIFQVYPTGSSGTTGALKLRIEGVAGASIIQANSDVNWANHDIIINAANTTGAAPIILCFTEQATSPSERPSRP